MKETDEFLKTIEKSNNFENFPLTDRMKQILER
jgi:hypothetical protein